MISYASGFGDPLFIIFEILSMSHWYLFYFSGPSSGSAQRTKESLVCWWDFAQWRSCWCSQINNEWNFFCRNPGCVAWPSQANNYQSSTTRGKKNNTAINDKYLFYSVLCYFLPLAKFRDSCGTQWILIQF